MRLYTSLILLSLVSIPFSVHSLLSAKNKYTTKLQSTSAPQLLAVVQTDIERDQGPHPGRRTPRPIY